MAQKKLEIKSWKESRTVWFNVVAISLLVAETLLQNVIGLPSWLNEVLSGVVAVGNLYLRFNTTQPIK